MHSLQLNFQTKSISLHIWGFLSLPITENQFIVALAGNIYYFILNFEKIYNRHCLSLIFCFDSVAKKNLKNV